MPVDPRKMQRPPDVDTDSQECSTESHIELLERVVQALRDKDPHATAMIVAFVDTDADGELLEVALHGSGPALRFMADHIGDAVAALQFAEAGCDGLCETCSTGRATKCADKSN